VARANADQDVTVALLVGAELMDAAAQRAPNTDERLLCAWRRPVVRAPGLESDVSPELAAWAHVSTLGDLLSSADLGRLMDRCGDPDQSMTSEIFSVSPNGKRHGSAPGMRCSRSASPDPSRHGTFADVRSRLPYVEQMGFDVLYLPPIHRSVDRAARSGWRDSCRRIGSGQSLAIGSIDGVIGPSTPTSAPSMTFENWSPTPPRGGSTSPLISPFRHLPIILVKDHPEWFRRLPDGTIRYAENPPKRYEDVYPLDFDTPDWQTLWTELLDVVRFWIQQGVKVFRVDNPHTKPFAFWEWMIRSVRTESPDVLFLAEAFTRPKVMEQLAKLGFTQSYTYFTCAIPSGSWRRT